MISRSDRMVGVILGTAVGDAIGLPFEGILRGRVRRMAGSSSSSPSSPSLGHRLVLGRGMVSDDTEHTCMAAQALLVSGGDPDRFARSLSWRLRWWLLGLPAGVGKATARAAAKLWLGFPPSRSGVRSAGNGPAMRAAVLGVYAAGDPGRLAALVRSSTRLTHTDARAELGALAVAVAAAYACEREPHAVSPREFAERLRAYSADAEMLRVVGLAVAAADRRANLDDLTAELGVSRGVSGYIYHCVPVALFCWLRWPGDFRAAVEAAVLAGGDTDTTAAVVGALVGSTTGQSGLPGVWLDRIMEWPRSVKWMKALGERLAQQAEPGDGGRGGGAAALPLFWPGLILRNAFFLVVVVLHAFRRLLPPY